MNGFRQKVIPAVRHLKDLEAAFRTEYEFVVLMNVHVAMARSIVSQAAVHGKKILLHADLIDGLKSDEYAAEFLAQEVKPAGIISTRNNVLLTAKKKGLLTIQRFFLLDSLALENSYVQIGKTKPDYVELLPGIMPVIIKQFAEATSVPVIAGGLIRTEEDIRLALGAGAVAVTTSRKPLWNAAAE
ncbi:glycerol-3-phosphate responsive antiterminator GlpP [Cohnella sp. CFH 77786]|uniref:glycerol-3-phosphate responsive antiterminator n=1 Tax=Cohnella sp. CFH 77786 TaxID=2662265 RepID=UPI001C60AEF7|nr:glycerol-3-phosphate responsive antiterminator [Cohnella sp. CFH 77786]MBW5445658.1 glycerol-3-phosphate responsive antiterminator GlpP [Cohnella sp. CFH 77786]